ncbi:hypothetical protein LR48_Vigan04g085100 [Vigna angularis]|uniref:Uncharacterized protein n=1 Tax=Phaseolus angularis TaxID=3914 RepID=A0A0L9UD19_PHAAN|nr:hypothetical protein LR48_Vigan04g085100 [Vigna angularis]
MVQGAQTRSGCDIRALTRAGSDAGARGMVQGAQTRSGSWQLRVEGTRAGSDAGARGMVQGAQTRSGSWQLRVEGVHGRIGHTPE